MQQRKKNVVNRISLDLQQLLTLRNAIRAYSERHNAIFIHWIIDRGVHAADVVDGSQPNITISILEYIRTRRVKKTHTHTIACIEYLCNASVAKITWDKIAYNT